MFAGYFQIGEKLGFVHREESLYCLQFDDHFPHHDQVDLISAVELQSLIENRK
jgi:hypothetical protein